jgi:hypothetical protein
MNRIKFSLFLVGAAFLFVFASPVFATEYLNTKPAGSVVIIESDTVPYIYKFMKVNDPTTRASFIWELCSGETGTICNNNIGEAGHAWGADNSIQSFVTGNGAGLWLNSVYLTNLGHLDWFELNCWGMGVVSDSAPADIILSEQTVFVKAYVSLPSISEWKRYASIGHIFPDFTTRLRIAPPSPDSYHSWLWNASCNVGNGCFALLPVPNAYGIAPVLYLKPNIAITGGDGTNDFPYSLELVAEDPQAYLQSVPALVHTTAPSTFAQNLNPKQFLQVNSLK